MEWKTVGRIFWTLFWQHAFFLCSHKSFFSLGNVKASTERWGTNFYVEKKSTRHSNDDNNNKINLFCLVLLIYAIIFWDNIDEKYRNFHAKLFNANWFSGIALLRMKWKGIRGWKCWGRLRRFVKLESEENLESFWIFNANTFSLARLGSSWLIDAS